MVLVDGLVAVVFVDVPRDAVWYIDDHEVGGVPRSSVPEFVDHLHDACIVARKSDEFVLLAFGTEFMEAIDGGGAEPVSTEPL